MWLKYLGLFGPNGEKENEVREYPEDVAESYLHIWFTHFVKATDEEIEKVKSSVAERTTKQAKNIEEK